MAAAPLPFEDAEAPSRELARDPFLVLWRALELLALRALLREAFDLACEPLDRLRAFFALLFEALFALLFEALAPFFAFELREDAREDLAEEDFR